MCISKVNLVSAVCKLTICFVLYSYASASIAKPSLNFNVQNAHGDTVALSDYIGSVVYVDFWASWCGPCRKSFPWMNSMHQKYANQGLKIIAINLDTEATLAKQFLTLAKAKFEVAYDVKKRVAGEFDILGMPSSYLFNRQGELVAKHVGFYSENQIQYEAEIKHWLNHVEDSQ